MQVGPIDGSLVKHHACTGPQARADRARPFGVVGTGGVDQGKARQLTVPIQPHMTLGGGLAPAGLGPIQTGGDALERGRIHHADGGLEPRRQPWRPAPPAAKRGDCRCSCSSVAQKRFSASGAGRCLLAGASVLREGAVAPRRPTSFPQNRRQLSQTSFRPRAWVNGAQSKATPYGSTG